MQLNAEIDNQLRMLSGNTDLMKKALDYLKSLTAQLKPAKRESRQEKTRKWLESFAGKWEDGRSADEMIADIYASRKSSNYDEMINILNK